MRRIMVLNAKGGSGKTLLSTNLASYYAWLGKSVVLADLDPQQSSLGWLSVRSDLYPRILGAELKDGRLRVPGKPDYLIMDTAAGSFGQSLSGLVQRAHTILVPVQPSPTDLRAAARFIHDLMVVGRVTRNQTRVALVANRVRQSSDMMGSIEKLLNGIMIPFKTQESRNTQNMEDFLGMFNVPLIATLSDSTAYYRADTKGAGVFELDDTDAAREKWQWQPIIDWLNSRKSQPVGKNRK